jgi:hypothetical protein
MPSSISSSDETRGFPLALLVSLCLFFGIDFVVWNYQPWLVFCARYASAQSASDPLRTTARIRLLSPESPPPVLLVGSSQVLEGLDCARFRERFPGRACQNLAIAGGTPLDVLFLTDRIDRRLPKRVLVTAVSPQTLHGAPKRAFSDLRTLRCLARGRGLGQLAPREWIDVLYGQAQALSETLRNKDALRELWRTVGGDPWEAIRLERPPEAPRVLDDAPLPADAALQARLGVVDAEIAPGRFTRTQEAALDEVLERERSRGNLVVVLDFPTRRGYETTVTEGAVLHHRKLLERLTGRPGIRLVRREDLPPLDDVDFRDFVHPRATGRDKISRGVAAILGQLEAAPVS